MAILGWQVNYIWKELQYKHGRKTCELGLAIGRQMPLIQILGQDDLCL